MPSDLTMLSLYTTPPSGTILLENLYEVTFQRYKLLSVIQKATIRFKEHTPKWRLSILQNIQKLKRTTELEKYSDMIQKWYLLLRNKNDEAMAHIDYASHWMLRTIISRCQPNIREWFVKQETDLFTMRLFQLSIDQMRKLKEENNITCLPISSEELSEIDDFYQQWFKRALDGNVLYKVPFTTVSKLVGERKVLVKNGFAYISEPQLKYYIVHVFVERLYLGIRMERSLDRWDFDERLQNLTKYLQEDFKKTCSTVYKHTDRLIDIEDLDSLCKRSFPLCMRHIYEQLKQKHHLKYFAREQFGLFLRDIGLTLEQSLNFWYDWFGKNMDDETYRKKRYAYKIKYNYGYKKNAMHYSDIPSYTCRMISHLDTKPGQCHGCPFISWSEEILIRKLTDLGFSDSGVADILNCTRHGDYDTACSKYFKNTHNHPYSEGVIHPNNYFETSRQVYHDTYLDED